MHSNYIHVPGPLGVNVERGSSATELLRPSTASGQRGLNESPE